MQVREENKVLSAGLVLKRTQPKISSRFRTITTHFTLLDIKKKQDVSVNTSCLFIINKLLDFGIAMSVVIFTSHSG